MLIYNLILYIIYILIFPYVLLKRISNSEEWQYRLAKKKLPIQDGKSVWFHCASVGEVNAVVPLVKKFRETHSENIYFSTMTLTGFNRASVVFANDDKIIPFIIPLDIKHLVRKIIKQIKPNLLVLIETELWFNLINEVSKCNGIATETQMAHRGIYGHGYRNNYCKIVLINGRLSELSFKRYAKIKWLLQVILRKIDKIGAKSAEDKKRFIRLGANNVELTGNIKFAISLPKFDKWNIRRALHLTKENIITIGSSRPGEEKLVINLLHYLKRCDIDIQIILAPRHLHRLSEIENLLKRNDVNYQKLSAIQEQSTDYDILLVDKMGELIMAYAISDLAIVGGSFYNFGGHNPLEPAFYGIPIIMGKYHQNCQESIDSLVKAKAGKIVEKEKLSEEVKFLLQNKELMEQMGANGKQVLLENRQSLDRSLELIEKFCCH